MPNAPDYVCAICNEPLVLDSDDTAVCCDINYMMRGGVLSYDWRRILFLRHRCRFLFASELSNNAQLAYQNLREGSLALEGKEDVDRFRSYVLAHAERGRVLDVGCGLLPLAGYLVLPEQVADEYEIYGLDPLPPEAGFRGARIVGCSEYLPLQSGMFDTLIFGTSLDHVAVLDRTLREAARVLRPGGVVVIWMSDRSGFRRDLRRQEARETLRGLLGRQPRLQWVQKMGRYFVYPDLTVMSVPRGAIDPYHTYNESPSRVTRRMERLALVREDLTKCSLNEVYLTFRKRLG